jgi:hypothetical protein
VLARQNFVQRDPECEEVASLIDRLALDLLRRHVGNGSEDRAAIGRGRREARINPTRRRQPARKAEVEHLDVAIGPHHDVVRLQVAVDDAAPMGRGERRQDLTRDAKAARQWQRALQALPQRRAGDQLHDQIVVADVVQRADVRMIQRGDRPRLVHEPLAGGDVVDDAARQHLDRHGAIEPGIAGFVHLAHPAGADPGLDDIGAQHGAARERRRRPAHRRVAKAAALVMGAQQPCDLPLQGRIAATCVGNEGLAIDARARQRQVEHRADAAPALRRHRRPVDR